MKKIIPILMLTVCFNVKAQLYYGSELGIFTGENKVHNEITNKDEAVKFGSFFFNVPVGIKNAYNVLFEGDVAYAGLVVTSANVGYQIGDDKGNVQLLAGLADFIEVQPHFKMVHSFSYNGIARLNLGHFFIQTHYSDKTIFFGLGFKAFRYE